MDSLRDDVKRTNIEITGAPGGKERDKGTVNLSEEIMAENFLNLVKERAI